MLSSFTCTIVVVDVDHVTRGLIHRVFLPYVLVTLKNLAYGQHER